MGNYGSYNGSNTYVNPFIMVDSAYNFNTPYSRFACDINDSNDKDIINQQTTQNVKDPTLALMFKNMVISYDGSKQLTRDSQGNIIGSDYIPSPGNNLPGGAYKDSTGTTNLPVYKYMACCKGAAGINAINTNNHSVAIPIASVVRPSTDITQPIYNNIVSVKGSSPVLKPTTTSVTVVNSQNNTKTFVYDPDYKNKILSLSDTDLDNIIYSCANNGVCLKSNHVGLQINKKSDADLTNFCSNYTPTGQDSTVSNSNALPTALCNNFMRHVCAKQLYDQGCTTIKLDQNNNKYPAWNDIPTCRVYNGLSVSNPDSVNYLYSGSPDCTCLNSVHGYTLNNKPYYVNGSQVENPFGFTPNDNNLIKNDSVTPYALNVMNQNPYSTTIGDGDPQTYDGDCVTSLKNSNAFPYVLPGYYPNAIQQNCINIVNISNNTANILGINSLYLQNNFITRAEFQKSQEQIQKIELVLGQLEIKNQIDNTQNKNLDLIEIRLRQIEQSVAVLTEKTHTK